jgi:hypothetical protein
MQDKENGPTVHPAVPEDHSLELVEGLKAPLRR